MWMRLDLTFDYFYKSALIIEIFLVIFCSSNKLTHIYITLIWVILQVENVGAISLRRYFAVSSNYYLS